MDYLNYSFSRYFDRADYKITACRNVYRFLSSLFFEASKERRKDEKNPNCLYYKYVIQELGKLIPKYADIPNPPIEICVLYVYLGETRIHKDFFHTRANTPSSEHGLWYYEEKWRTARLMMSNIMVMEYDKYKTTQDETPSRYYILKRDGVYVKEAKSEEENKLQAVDAPPEVRLKIAQIICEFEDRMTEIPTLQDIGDGNPDDETLIKFGRELREPDKAYKESFGTENYDEYKKNLYEEFDKYAEYIYQNLVENPKKIARNNLPIIVYDDTGNVVIDGKRTKHCIQVYWRYQKDQEPPITDLIRTNLDPDYCGTDSYLYKLLTNPKTFLYLVSNELVAYLKPTEKFDDLTKMAGLPWYPVEEIKELPTYDTSEKISYDIRARIFAAAHEYNYMIDPEFTIGLWLQNSPKEVAAELTEEYERIFSDL